MLWTQARVRGFHIATQDSDFLDIAELRGVPPKILLVRLGNLTTAQLLASIEPVLADLPVLLETSSLGVAIEGKQGVTRPL